MKEYPIELKPLFSAFGLKTLSMTTVRALLMFYLPLLEPRSNLEEDDDDFPSDTEDERVDLVTPLKKSVKQIFREVITIFFCFLCLPNFVISSITLLDKTV